MNNMYRLFGQRELLYDPQSLQTHPHTHQVLFYLKHGQSLITFLLFFHSSLQSFTFIISTFIRFLKVIRHLTLQKLFHFIFYPIDL